MISPGVHGGDGWRLAAALGVDPSAILDLSASLNPFAPDAGEVVAKHVDAVVRYPNAAIATRALAEAMGVDADRLLLTNGGSEAIALVSAVLGGWVDEPEFGLHPRGGSGPRWRSDPHNPSGQLAAVDQRAGVWDEAFYPLAVGRWSAGRSGSVVVGSLTKVFACPGLRVGYVLGPTDGSEVGCELVERLRRIQPQWSLSGLAAESVPSLLEGADLKGWAGSIAEMRRLLVGMLRGGELTPEPSDANWVLVRAPGLRTALSRFGILVRDCQSFGLPGYVRIAVPGPDGLARLDRALAQMEFPKDAEKDVEVRY
ncbi:MAG: aminotransferase class I/II-fold pyridoxal phosphate-dependent enzyme [Pseudonocardiaceae bacterium]